ncbi:NAD(P)/FAD-dependent oxidoreductase [Alteromonas sp. a30]|uniref:NAD(P)/FAD-dependent oxidoreductase n=1 Tax=Alteromonas sp. a30 TaxID=2730917 RepID=UPI00227E2DD7|nr:FAD-dependent oxidoreductase [Alteromonas sp. a30]MCY7294501.1 FAD-dependent oxidoreductase [Alteromonas sp. a30]
MYDPLAHPQLSPNQPYPESFWAFNTGKRLHFPQLEATVQTEVVIIGAGFTGLSAAIALREKGVETALVEANSVGWGCAGRNAGFALPGSGRLGFSALKSAYGKNAAIGIISEYYQAVDNLKHFIDSNNLQVDLVQGGYLKIASKAKDINLFEQQLNDLPSTYASKLSLLSAQEVDTHFIETHQQFGGLYNSSSFGINPLKMALAMAELARENGAHVFQNSPVLSYEKAQNASHGKRYVVTTTKGKIYCDHIILATNAYTPNKSLPVFYRAQFPVLSSVLVTHPLRDEQLKFVKQAGLMCMDTRALKYYYRLLPGNRILFGGRGAVWGYNHDSPLIKRKLINALKSSFPNLDDARIDYFWSGWVSVSQDEIPHIGSLPSDPNIHFAMGYCGSGVAFTHTAGKRLAQLVTSKNDVPELPIYNTFPKDFPFAPFRRLGLWGYYQWQSLMDWVS